MCMRLWDMGMLRMGTRQHARASPDRFERSCSFRVSPVQGTCEGCDAVASAPASAEGEGYPPAPGEAVRRLFGVDAGDLLCVLIAPAALLGVTYALQGDSQCVFAY